ncbi:threonine synthase [Namhaeicola litoreus]|uniref:Threonine synthase n=1 Tax=Namhaeicola litoreus TaxID=1052145 RepID=A0ABW3Y5M9_9FLAO
MKYYSLNRQAPDVNFKQAVVDGIAPDKGLYFPSEIKSLPQEFFKNIQDYTYNEIAYHLIEQFVGDEIPEKDLKKIIEDTLSFDFPLVNVNDDIFALELFHGPTMAFKDVGGRFMARCLSYFNKNENNEVTVLVATSGDTGGAVASGFLGVKGVNVVILYPSKKVSEVQEKQLTTLGQNIKALEVNGTFDDCQAMVKNAFIDREITSKIKLTSANSINVARWLPQMFYFAFAYKQLANKDKQLAIAVPSGNFGNICAGMMAQKLGLPIDQFIAANNANSVVTQYLDSGKYNPKPSVQTISNAMDVGDPSNFIRIQEIYQNDFNIIREHLVSYAFDDETTRAAMEHVYKNQNYILDPHGAVGYLGLDSFLKNKTDWQGIFLETAHPVKFLDVVEPVIKTKIDYPEQILAVIDKQKQSTVISTYEELKSFLLNG